MVFYPWQSLWKGDAPFFFESDIIFGIIKSFVFGFVITSIACYKGYYAFGGAEGVGNATTRATVLVVSLFSLQISF